MTRNEFVALCCTLLLLCLPLAGCGGAGAGLASVTGTVTLDGQPLPDAEVEFQPNMATGGSPSYGKTNENGQYELMFTFDKKGAMPGEHTVTVAREVPDPNTPGALIEETFTLADPNRTVQSGKNVIDLEVQRSEAAATNLQPVPGP